MSHANFAVQPCAFHHLYLVRYALTHEKNDAMDKYPLLKKRGGLVSGKGERCPWDFHYTLRALRQGHIYVYNDGVWASFTVFRTEAVQGTPFRIRVNPEWTQAYLAYSELLWSEEYQEYLLAHPDTMAQRMQLVKLQGAPEGNEHTADIADYSALVEEYREKPGCLKSLRDFLPSIFDPLDLAYSGDEKLFQKEVGRRWRCSAHPFGDWDKRSPLEAVPEEMRYIQKLPPHECKPYQNEPFSKPAVWTLDPAQKKDPPKHPLIVALEDPLGEARDLDMVHQCNLEDYETYVGYYHHTVVLSNLLEGLHVSRQRIVHTCDYGIGEPPSEIEILPPRDERGSRSSHTVDYGTVVNMLDEYVPGHPWAYFMDIYNREINTIKTATASYVEKWCKWLIVDEPGGLLRMRDDFSIDPAIKDGDFKTPCEEITAATVAYMGDTEKGFEYIQVLFSTDAWYRFFKSSLLTSQIITRHTETLVDVLCKAATFFVINGNRDKFKKQKDDIKKLIIQKTGQPMAPEMANISENNRNSDTERMTLQEVIPYITELNIRFDTGGMEKIFTPKSPFEAHLNTKKFVGYTTKTFKISKKKLLVITSRMGLPEKNVRFLLNSVQVVYDLYKAGDSAGKVLGGKERDSLKILQEYGEGAASVLGLSITVISIREFRSEQLQNRLSAYLKWCSYATLIVNSLLTIAEDIRNENYGALTLSICLALCNAVSIPSATFPPAFIIFVLSSLMAYWREQLVQEKKLTDHLSACFWNKRKLTVFSYARLLAERNKNDPIYLATEKEVSFFEQMLMRSLALKVQTLTSGGGNRSCLMFTILYLPDIIESDSVKVKIEEKWGWEDNYVVPEADVEHAICYAVGKEQTPSQVGIFLHVPTLMAGHEARYHSLLKHEPVLRRETTLAGHPTAREETMFHIRLTVEFRTKLTAAVQVLSVGQYFSYMSPDESIPLEERVKPWVEKL